MSHHSANVREMLQELGAPPEVPTKQEFNKLVAKFEPERLAQVKAQLKEVLKRNQNPVEPPQKLIRSTDKVTKENLAEPVMDNNVGSVVTTEPSKINRTHILEMELLKLKGQFYRNKTNTMNLIKKLSNERELVKDSIKELSSTRREELDLVEAIKRDNLELMLKKNQLEMDLMDITERMEMLLGSLSESQMSNKEKEARLKLVEMERFEMSKKIETLELKVKINHFEPQRRDTFDWNAFISPLCFKSLLVLLICIAVFNYFYSSPTQAVLPDSTCIGCDYERNIYKRINI